ncbi:MAG: DUF2333 family protein [Gammaproteobacteria bacterium]|nr:DUF2333 family protein [Gammaproteobacteria bacterium]
MRFSLFKNRRNETPDLTQDASPANGLRRVLFVAIGSLCVLVIALGIYWSREPAQFTVTQNVNDRLAAVGYSYVVGSATAAALIQVTETLLEKPGGYLSNDKMPPGLYLDNIPNWEFGALVQVRDFAKAFRESFSRSQSQSVEDPDLIVSDPKLNISNDSWIFPSAENEYREAIVRLNSYMIRISDANNADAQFYARADNLSRWLLNVESRLGSLSQRLSASVRQGRVNIDVAGEPAATQSTPSSNETSVKTPWLQIDNNFYEARGATWALIHFLKAAELDFKQVLDDKNANASLRQIIRDLEYSQRMVFFPIILNGSGFGVFANHSLTMANYISRANAAISDLRELLAQG